MHNKILRELAEKESALYAQILKSGLSPVELESIYAQYKQIHLDYEHFLQAI